MICRKIIVVGTTFTPAPFTDMSLCEAWFNFNRPYNSFRYTTVRARVTCPHCAIAAELVSKASSKALLETDGIVAIGAAIFPRFRDLSTNDRVIALP